MIVINLECDWCKKLHPIPAEEFETLEDVELHKTLCKECKEEQEEDYDDEPAYNCLCRGAGACIQCNPRMFI